MSVPELEACGWYVRTKRTNEDSAGWLIADCSSSPHGAEYARQFAATRDMIAALEEVLKTPGLQSSLQALCAAAIAKATGRDVADVIKGCDMAASKLVVALLPEQMQARLTAGVCVSCGEKFTDANVFTNAGWAETRISQTCERCFDALFEDEDD